jgi:small subunit ribosomal protein S3
MASERKFVTEKIRRVLLKEYVMKDVGRAGFGGIEVQRTPMGTRVTLITERPGLVIGRRGESIKNLTQAIEQRFNFNNPQIEVQEVENPNLNAQIMAEKLANALERGWHFRRAGHSTVRRIMESGARGCQVMIAGKLTGQRHRREKFKSGHIKFCGQAKLDFMDKGYAVAKMKPGVIGVSVQIMHPDARLPDEITIIPPPPVTAPATEVAPAAGVEKEVEKAQEADAAEAVEELKKAAEEDAKAKKPSTRAKKKVSATGEAKKPRKRPAKKKDEAAKAEPEAEKGPAEAKDEPKKDEAAKAEPDAEKKPAETKGEPKKDEAAKVEPDAEKKPAEAKTEPKKEELAEADEAKTEAVPVEKPAEGDGKAEEK